jgi:hypothetical protein
MSYIADQLKRIGLVINYVKKTPENEYPYKVSVRFSHVNGSTNEIGITNNQLTKIYRILSDDDKAPIAYKPIKFPRRLGPNRRRGLRRNPMRRTVSKVGLMNFIEDAYYNDRSLPENKKWLKRTLAKIKKLKGGVYDIQVIQNMLRDLRDADRGNNDNYWYLVIDKITSATGIGPE